MSMEDKDDDMAQMAALDEIKGILTKHWMRKPKSQIASAPEGPASDEDLPDEADGFEEPEGEELEESIESPISKPKPLRVMDFGSRHAAERMAPARGESIPPPMMKHGRGRPPKAR